MTMRITAILLKNYRQFGSFYLPLLDPQTGEALTKVCFIGANATGKSTLLALIAKFLESGTPQPLDPEHDEKKSIVGFRIQLDREQYYVVTIHSLGPFVFDATIETNPAWQELWSSGLTTKKEREVRALIKQLPSSLNEIHEKIKLQPNSTDLAIYAPPDGTSLIKVGDRITGLPHTDLNNALKFFNHLPAFHSVSYDRIEDFWNFLIYQIKKRESDFQAFLNALRIHGFIQWIFSTLYESTVYKATLFEASFVQRCTRQWPRTTDFFNVVRNNGVRGNVVRGSD